MIIYTCPTCGKRCTYQRAEDAPSRPFCSERCQQIDLGKWLREDYRISEPSPGCELDDQLGANPSQE